MAEGKINWLDRGREYQAQGVLADAIWCFEKATKEAHSSEEAHFLLGQAWWGLGDVKKAYTAWRRGHEKHPAALRCLQAMAEALLHLDDLEGASELAREVLEKNTGEPRAEILCAFLALKRGDVSQLSALADWAEDRKAVFCDTAFARTLAKIFDAVDAESAPAQHFSRALLKREVAWPPVLMASLLRRVLTSDAQAEHLQKARALLAQPVLEQDADCIRKLAVTLHQTGHTEEAKDFLQWYGEIQETVYKREKQQTARLPWRWSRRTAGEALRMALLLPPWRDDAEGSMKNLLPSVLQALPCRPDVWVAGAPERWQSVLDAAVKGNERLVARSLPADPADPMLSFDYDALLDIAGMQWPVETFLLKRPARNQWFLRSAAEALAPPLLWIDGIFENVAELTETLTAVTQAMPLSASLSAREFAERRDMALKEHQRGHEKQAREIYEMLLRDQPGVAALHYLLAVLAHDGGDKNRAIEHFSATIAAAPDYAASYQAFSEYLMGEDIARAQEVVDEGMARLPMAMKLCRIAGQIAAQQGDGAKAERIFGRLLAHDPANAEAHFDFGEVLHRQGRTQEAARSYQRALLFKPDMVEAHFYLGTLFQEQKHFGAAQDAYRYVLSKQPKHSRTYLQLGEVLAESGQLRAWFENFKQFQSHCPESIITASQGLEACQFMGDYKGINHFLAGLQHSRFKGENNIELIDALELLQYQLLFFDIDPDLSLQMARLYDAVMQKTFGGCLPRPAKRRPGKIRAGYLSADLRDHVMGRMVWSTAQFHDKERFELFFYSLEKRQDAVTEKFRGLADHFRVLFGLGEREAAAVIDADDLDILVDLSTNTKGARPGILALKPARVQITHIASAGTLGLSAVDFKLTDHDADLPEMQPYQIEQFLPMRGCVYPYQHIVPAAQHPYDRRSLGLPEDAILIGVFVVPMKLSARCVALWKRVLDRIPKGKLVFSPLSSVYVQIYRNLMKSAGIPEDRYLFLPSPGNLAMRQARYAMIDFVLDPMPFGNVNGTLEPLDAGVPVVTLVGRRHGERSSYSILKNLGETRTVANDGTEYVDIAVRLSGDPAFMSEVRAGIRRGLEGSLLTDMRQHCRHLEEAYLKALEMKAPEVLM